MQVIIDTPVSPITSWGPLLFVIISTAVKQAYEDYLRHRRDRQVNSKLVHVVLDDGKLQVG